MHCAERTMNCRLNLKMIRVSPVSAELTHTHTGTHSRKYMYTCSTQAINSRIEIKTQFTRPGFPRVFKNVRSVYNMLTAATVARGRGDDDERPHSYIVYYVYTKLFIYTYIYSCYISILYYMCTFYVYRRVQYSSSVYRWYMCIIRSSCKLDDRATAPSFGS